MWPCGLGKTQSHVPTAQGEETAGGTGIKVMALFSVLLVALQSRTRERREDGAQRGEHKVVRSQTGVLLSLFRAQLRQLLQERMLLWQRDPAWICLTGRLFFAASPLLLRL